MIYQTKTIREINGSKDRLKAQLGFVESIQNELRKIKELSDLQKLARLKEKIELNFKKKVEEIE